MYYNEKIKYVRESKNITQIEMAKHLNIDRRQYARYENGINKLPIQYLVPISKYLNVSLEYILGESDYVNLRNDKKTKKKITN